MKPIFLKANYRILVSSLDHISVHLFLLVSVSYFEELVIIVSVSYKTFPLYQVLRTKGCGVGFQTRQIIIWPTESTPCKLKVKGSAPQKLLFKKLAVREKDSQIEGENFQF